MGRQIPMWQCILTIVAMVVFLFWNVMYDDGGEAHVGLILAACVAGIIGAANGWKWSYMEAGILAAINRSMQAMLILAVVGAMIASWKAGGVIPSMMYFGIKVISPSVFLFTACLLCSIVSLATGSSWSTAGSMGVAIIGIGTALGFSSAMTAGAVVSGAYFGDKMSPLSDTTTMKVYTEAVRYGKYKDNHELEKYLSRIDEKADQINELADGILKYSKKSARENEECVGAHASANAKRQINIEEFIILVNEKIADYLEMRGLKTVIHNNCDDGEITVSDALIQRLMDNVVSNIEKYADESENIIISLDRERSDKTGAVVLSIDNKIREAAENTEDEERRGIGIMTIAKLMGEMNGFYEYEEKYNHFIQKMVWIE